jgi:hypothetical protein
MPASLEYERRDCDRGVSPEARERDGTSQACAKSRPDFAQRGTIIEVSEWKSREAIDVAHKNSNVLAMWEKFFAICDCVPFRTLAEAEEMFPNFEPL